MTFQPGQFSKLYLPLLLACLTPFAAAATGKKAAVHGHHPVAAAHKTTAAGTRKGGHLTAGKISVKGNAKGKKARIPRTLRTIHVSPVVRENAVQRVEANLTASASSPFIYPSQLQRFFKALDFEQNERAVAAPGTAATTVRILQFGDSHTAADIFTGAMRAHIQQQFGDGGLGFQFPGHPFAGYHLAGSLRSQSAGWLTEGNRFTALGDGDLGLGGISIATEQAGQAITLETSCTTLQLHYLQQPGGGRLQFSDNGVVLSTIATATADAGAANGAGTFSYSCSPGQHDFAFTTLDQAPVKLLGVVSEQPGVTYECLGINGAIAPLMLRWNQDLFANYLRQRAPDLIVLAYGTNEAGGSAEHLETYPDEFGRLIDNLHRIVPDASILVIGPEDRATVSHRAWRPFTGIDRIVAMQKEACRTHGCAFWDARRRMGGFGSMQQWVAAGWAQPDRTHLTGTGYHELADALYADLIHAYNVNQQHPEIPVQESRNGKAPRNP
jgi:lysophospholipase L1-like esterase